jgi:hypothetical protein
VSDASSRQLPWSDFVRAYRLDGGTFTLGSREVTVGAFSFPVADVPASAELARPRKVVLRLPDAEVTETLRRVTPVMYRDDSLPRPHLAALHIRRIDGVVQFTALEGCRMARVSHPSKGRPFAVLIPAAAIEALGRMTGDLALRMDGDDVLLRRGRSWVRSTVNPSIGAPKYDDVIPTMQVHKVTADGATLRGIVGGIKRHVKSRAFKEAPIRLEGALRVSAMLEGIDGEDKGRVTATVPAVGSIGVPVDVNAKYLLDAIGDGEVTIETSGVLDPITVRDGNVLSVAMPMRVGR